MFGRRQMREIENNYTRATLDQFVTLIETQLKDNSQLPIIVTACHSLIENLASLNNETLFLFDDEYRLTRNKGLILVK